MVSIPRLAIQSHTFLATDSTTVRSICPQESFASLPYPISHGLVDHPQLCGIRRDLTCSITQEDDRRAVGNRVCGDELCRMSLECMPETLLPVLSCPCSAACAKVAG